MSSKETQGDMIAKLLGALERQLLELGVEPVEAVLDAQINVIERAAVHDAVLNLVIYYVGVGYAAAGIAVCRAAASADTERRSLEIALLARALEVRVKGVETDQRLIGRPKLQRGGHAEPLLVIIVPILAREAWVLGGIDDAAVSRGRI